MQAKKEDEQEKEEEKEEEGARKKDKKKSSRNSQKMKYSACLVGFKATLKAIGSFVFELKWNWKILQVKLGATVEGESQ